MKCYILVDIPVDDPVEIDEYGMYATLQVCPFVPSTKKEMYFDVVKEIRPLPSRRRSIVEWIDAKVKTHEFTEYDKGWNDCVDYMEGGEK